MHNTRSKGMAIAALGIFIISFDALLVRLADTDASVIALYRGLFMSISMFVLFFAINKTKWFPNSKFEFLMFVLVVFFAASSTSLFVFSVKYTNPSNTVVLLATSPFFAAIFSYLFIKEKIGLNTIIAIIFSFVGVLIVFGDSFGMEENYIGDLMGLLLSIFMGLELTLLRKYPHFPHMLIIALSGLTVATLMSIVVENPFEISHESFFWLAIMGFVHMPISMYLIFLATRFITSAEVSLFSMIETTFAPIWLWLFLSEIPPKMTLVGGVFILIAIVINARQSRKI